MLPPPTLPAAGWYPTSDGSGQRYFDGHQWRPSLVFEGPSPAHPSLPIGCAVGGLLVLAASLTINRLSLFGAADSTAAGVAVSGLIGYGPSLAWCWYVWRRHAGRRLETMGLRFRASDSWRGLATYLVAIGVQISVALILLVLNVPIARNVGGSDAGQDLGYLIAAVTLAVGVAPVVEELIFRGVVMRGLLSTLRPALAVTVQGSLFGFAHFDPARSTGNLGLTVVLGGVGCVFGASAYLARRIGPAVIAHALFNGIVMTIVLSGVLEGMDPTIGQ